MKEIAMQDLKMLIQILINFSFQVDVKSEGSNVIVVKMTFPENENIQGLRAYSPTQPSELEKFEAVHNALDPNARIEQVPAVNLDEQLPELRRDERGLEKQNFFSPPVNDVTISNQNYVPSSDDVIDFSKDIIGSHMQYTEPPTRPPRPTKPAPSSSSSTTTPSPTMTTTTTPTPIDRAIFPLEYFTESDVKVKEKRNILPGNTPPKVSHPIQYPSNPLRPPPRPKPAAVGFYQPAPPPPTPSPVQSSQSYSNQRSLTPPPRPQPFRPATYSNILTPEPGFTYSGPNPGYY
jgi:hypothetical protein